MENGEDGGDSAEMYEYDRAEEEKQAICPGWTLRSG